MSLSSLRTLLAAVAAASIGCQLSVVSHQRRHHSRRSNLQGHGAAGGSGGGGLGRLLCLLTLLASCGSSLLLTTAQAPDWHHQHQELPPSAAATPDWDAAYHADDFAAAASVSSGGGGYRSSSSSGSSHNHWKLVDSQVTPMASPKAATTANASATSATPLALTDDVEVDGGDDQVMSILSRPRLFSDSGEWSVLAADDVAEAAATAAAVAAAAAASGDEELVNCRPFANTTQYDHLRGIAARISLPNQAEPQVFSIFVQSGKPRPTERDVARAVSERLRAAPKSAHALNQAGNLLRYLGRTLGAVECFRKALSVSPQNADVLLNLGRVLFNHRYLEDATYLARRSLETQPANRNAWLQHFTLGEILRASGHTAEAAHHLRQAVSLKPEFKPAQVQLQLLEPAGQSSLTVYTLTIIAFLVLCVLAGLITTTEANLDAYGEVMKTQRHFNRAMAMRTLRMSINPRLARSRSPPNAVANAAAAAAAAAASTTAAAASAASESPVVASTCCGGAKDTNNN